MWTLTKPILIAVLLAAGLLVFSAKSAKAQVPAYGYTYASPYDYGYFGMGTFYNAVNTWPKPYLPTYIGFGSYYNYVNAPVYPYYYPPPPMYVGNFGTWQHRHHGRR